MNKPPVPPLLRIRGLSSSLLASALVVFSVACDGTTNAPSSSGKGGVTSASGGTGSGGTPAGTGGTALGGNGGSTGATGGSGRGTGGAGTGAGATGGVVGSGGIKGSGGTASSGGVGNSGGTVGAGGAVGSGGTSATGGRSANGGSTAAAGGSAIGGVATTGGTTGGAVGTAGAMATGGVAATGGAGTGGSTSSPGNCDESELVAFPCAEGYGKKTTGARGGEVYEVTNLNSSGAGSLGDGLSKSGRTIVFRVSGTIVGRFSLKDNTTIAGQTAPGDGITISGQLSLANNVIVRYIRVRFDGNGEGDAIGTRYKKNIIIDHVSGSWSTDEVMSIYHNEEVTIQWCMIAEACPKTGEDHRFGGIWGNQHATYHHNLLAHNASRNARFASGCGDNDYRNNVVYNWGYQNCYGGEAHQVNDSRNPPITYSKINLVANYYKPGPATTDNKATFAEGSTRNGDADSGSWFLSGNYQTASAANTSDNWKGMGGTYTKLSAAWAAMPIREQTAQAAYEAVLADVGSTRPKRDSIETRIIEETKNGTASTSRNGLVACPGDTKLPDLKSAPAPADSDHDGMPDAWETANGLDPVDASDRNKTWGPGYTMLEKYLNSIDSF